MYFSSSSILSTFHFSVFIFRRNALISSYFFNFLSPSSPILHSISVSIPCPPAPCYLTRSVIIHRL
eukprot:UN23525